MRGMNQNQENEKPHIEECGWGHGYGERSEETLDLIILCRDPICRFVCKMVGFE